MTIADCFPPPPPIPTTEGRQSPPPAVTGTSGSSRTGWAWRVVSGSRISTPNRNPQL
ncbi:MAG: hypothetical protein JXB30_14055 [Anaerolineae bacterium]|nr:hypothetical protein [Anaerolineae bacterium]